MQTANSVFLNGSWKFFARKTSFLAGIKSAVLKGV